MGIKITKLIGATALLILCCSSLSYAQKSTSKSDSTLSWFKDAKFGMSIHFDVGGDPGTWNPRNFDTDESVGIAKEAGMRYIVPTTRVQGTVLIPTNTQKNN